MSKFYLSPELLDDLYTKRKRTLNYIAFIYNVSRPTISNLLKKYGIPTRKTNGTYTNFISNSNYFKVWKPEMAYMLGYIAADGFVSKGTLHLVSIDYELLAFCREELGSNAPIIEKYSKGRLIYTFNVSNPEIIKDLNSLDIHTKKSLTISFPKYITNAYFWHYLRGYTDGDGCVYKVRGKSNIGINLIGSKYFIIPLRSILKTMFTRSISEPKPKGTSNAWSFDIGSNSAYHILKLMYDNKFYGLSRKKARALLSISSIDNKITNTIYCKSCLQVLNNDITASLFRDCTFCKKLRKHNYYVRKKSFNE